MRVAHEAAHVQELLDIIAKEFGLTRPKRKRTVWVNMYSDLGTIKPGVYTYANEEEAGTAMHERPYRWIGAYRVIIEE